MSLTIQSTPYDPQLKVIGATELKNKAGAVLDWADKTHTDLVIESRGKPKAVIMSYQDYKRVQQLRKQEERRQAFAEWEQLSQEVQAQNPGFTDEEVDQMAIDVSKELTKDVIKKRQTVYG